MKNLLFVAVLFTVFSCVDKKTREPTHDSQKTTHVQMDTTPRVTGVGGIFILSENPDSMMNWYGDNLGLKMDAFGSPFEFRNANDPRERNYLRWSAIGAEADFFNPSKKEFMINYRVYNIEALVEKLESNGSLMLDTIASYEYGKFVHLLDPEGNKIELWEPIDSVLSKMGSPTTK